MKLASTKTIFDSLHEDLRQYSRHQFALILTLGCILFFQSFALIFYSASKTVVIDRHQASKAFKQSELKHTKEEILGFARFSFESVVKKKDLKHLLEKSVKVPDLFAKHVVFEEIKLVTRGAEIKAFLITEAGNLQRASYRLKLATSTRNSSNPYGLVVTKWERI